jgi:hypothetical protein
VRIRRLRVELPQNFIRLDLKLLRSSKKPKVDKDVDFIISL